MLNTVSNWNVLLEEAARILSSEVSEIWELRLAVVQWTRGGDGG